jgi:hypothetical protein
MKVGNLRITNTHAAWEIFLLMEPDFADSTVLVRDCSVPVNISYGVDVT